MTKVHIIGSQDPKEFRHAINEFIQNKEVIDIKYQSLITHSQGFIKIFDRALIIYNENFDANPQYF